MTEPVAQSPACCAGPSCDYHFRTEEGVHGAEQVREEHITHSKVPVDVDGTDVRTHRRFCSVDCLIEYVATGCPDTGRLTDAISTSDDEPDVTYTGTLDVSLDRIELREQHD